VKKSVRDVLLAVGVSGDQLAAAEARFPSRTRRVEINTDKCPACGTKEILNGDFCCGACSEVKVRSERRFWQHAYDLEAGFKGRPKQLRPTKQALPPQSRRQGEVYLAPLPDELPPERKPEMREFLVTIGYVGLVIVAQYPYLAAREGRLALRVGETSGQSVLDMGTTNASPTHHREFWTADENHAAEEADVMKKIQERGCSPRMV
jgi:hypothetical protein